MAGLTDNGLEVRTQAEIQALIEEAVDAAFPGINMRAGPVQNLIGILSEELAIAWETLQATYAATYPDGANGVLLDQLAALTGTTRRAATRSVVAATVNLNAGVSLPAGSIAAVSGNPDAQFRLREGVTNGGGTPANVIGIFEALNTGPVAAPATSLTVIVTPVSGWNSVTNASAATLGRDEATDVELRAQRLVELAGAGSGTVSAIRAAVGDIDEVIDVAVYENTTLSTDGDGRPGKSCEVVVWDGDPAAADDDEIAQAIFGHKPAGILSHGAAAESGTATDETGAHTVAFTRASQVLFEIVAQVVLAPNTAAGWEAQAIAAIVARGNEYSVGEDVYASQFICALLEVPGIAAVTTLTIDGNALEVLDYDEIAGVVAGDVTVSEAP